MILVLTIPKRSSHVHSRLTHRGLAHLRRPGWRVEESRTRSGITGSSAVDSSLDVSVGHSDNGRATVVVATMTMLEGALVRLRPPTRADIPDLVDDPCRHRRCTEWWRGGNDMAAAIEEDLNEADITAYVIELEDRVVGWIQSQGNRPGLPPREHRHLRRPGGAQSGHRYRRGPDACAAPVRRPRPPSADDRSRGRQCRRDPLVQQGRFPACRRHACVRAWRRRLLARQPPHGPAP